MASRGAAPLITVIVPTFNCSASLRWALESIRGQELSSFEVWVVGDACSDDSEQVVSETRDSRFGWRNLERNSGSQAGPNNEGLRLARGKYVAYLSHDDVWFPWHLSRLVMAIEEAGADLVHSLCGLIGPEGALEVTGPSKTDITYESHFGPPSSWLHRTVLREECGPWGSADRLPLAVDREYLRRVHRAGKRISFLPELTVLKFPSMWWAPYRATSERPQYRYLEAVRSDPLEVERQVLRELSIEFARERYGGDDPWLRSFKRTIRIAGKAFLRSWGPDRWPLPGLMRWHYQRYRKSIRGARGLSSAGPIRERPGG